MITNPVYIPLPKGIPGCRYDITDTVTKTIYRCLFNSKAVALNAVSEYAVGQATLDACRHLADKVIISQPARDLRTT